jgi:hypothetical protein
VSVSAAPGVAFAYRYGFRLPADRIAGAQEQHAQACEKLGLSRCRITGLQYQLTGRHAIAASLSLKLDPVAARAFGKQGIATVEASNGMLIEAEITGTDTAGEIEQASGKEADATRELARIDRQLAGPGLKATERAELQRQRATLVQAVAQAKLAIDDRRATLAVTPMNFAYETGEATTIHGRASALTRAYDTAVISAETTLAVLLGAIALLGPPALVAAGLWFLFLRARRRWFPLDRSVRLRAEPASAIGPLNAASPED